MGRRELEAVGAREGGWGLGGGYGAGRAEAGERGEHRRHRNPRRCAATPTTSPRDPTWRIPANHERAEEKKKGGVGRDGADDEVTPCGWNSPDRSSGWVNLGRRREDGEGEHGGDLGIGSAEVRVRVRADWLSQIGRAHV